MLTRTRTTKTGEIKRTISASFALAGTCEARITETHGHKITTDTYLLSRQPSDFGIAFRVQKCDSEDAYDVLLNQPGGGHSCDCRWGTYKGHIKPCRHIETCLQVIRERKL